MIERLIYTLREGDAKVSRDYTADGKNSTECVSQQELDAVKTEMENKVGKLNSQLQYWQGVTINNIIQDHCKKGIIYHFNSSNIAKNKRYLSITLTPPV